jgi:predicted nucleic acid-binding protein
MDILSLPKSGYTGLKALRTKWGLDFDDAYQSAVAREFGLQIVTMDKHFEAVAKDIEVHFL